MPTTGFSDKRPPYVIFIKGTPAAFRKLEKKDPNALYYISEKEAHYGSLYLGDKLIASSSKSDISLKDLNDVLIDEGVEVNSLLVYDGEQWVNKALSEIFEIIVADFKGATADSPGEAGIVPAPAAGQQDYFLKGDGSWSKIEATVEPITFAQIDELFKEES